MERAMHHAEVTRETEACLSKTTCVCTCHICMLINYRRWAAQNGSSGSLWEIKRRAARTLSEQTSTLNDVSPRSVGGRRQVFGFGITRMNTGVIQLSPFPTPTLIPLCKFIEEPPLPPNQEHCPARITRVRDRADARSESRMLFS